MILFLGKEFIAVGSSSSLYERNFSNEMFMSSDKMESFLNELLNKDKDPKISKFVDTLFKYDKFKETRPLLIRLKEKWPEVQENLKLQENLINVFYILMFSKEIFQKLGEEINNNKEQSTDPKCAEIKSYRLEKDKSNCADIMFFLCYFITIHCKSLKADFISEFPDFLRI